MHAALRRQEQPRRRSHARAQRRSEIVVRPTPFWRVVRHVMPTEHKLARCLCEMSGFCAGLICLRRTASDAATFRLALEPVSAWASGARQPRDSLALPQQHGVTVIVSAREKLL